jgi:hypothetical protein
VEKNFIRIEGMLINLSLVLRVVEIEHGALKIDFGQQDDCIISRLTLDEFISKYPDQLGFNVKEKD